MAQMKQATAAKLPDNEMTTTKPVAAVVAKPAPAVAAQAAASTAQHVAVHEPAEAPAAAFLSGYDGPTGAENIESKDITIPRLKIGQAISDEVKSGQVVEGALFLNVTSTAIWNPGDAPLPCVIVGLGKEYILWRDRLDNGGGIIDRARPMRDAETGNIRYAWGDPNKKHTNKVKGLVDVVWETKTYIDEDLLDAWGTEIPGKADSGPAATAHHNYLLLLPTAGNVIAAMSMSRTGVKVAKGLNAAIKMGATARSPLPMLKFNLSAFEDASGIKPFMNWSIKPNGKLVNEQGRLVDPADTELATLAMGYFKQFMAGGYVVDLSDAKTPAGAGGKVDDMDGEEIPF